jgi:toxin secretion/phage lysis holin
MITGTAIAIYSNLGVAVLLLFALWFLDFLLGAYYGWINNNFSSTKIKAAGVKVCLYVITILALHMLDCIVKEVAPEYILKLVNCPFKNVWILFLALGEALSILENASALGLPVPEWIKNRLRVCQQDPFACKQLPEKGKRRK